MPATQAEATVSRTADAVDRFIRMRKAQERAATAEFELLWTIRRNVEEGVQDTQEYARQTQQWERDYEEGRIRFTGDQRSRA